ncbi:hypothetical protein EJ06DRAFT_559988 [Trichodelitschia bisporula]|uniref:Uncharacterized protein n=1 Tax=Trichodelitschia bisporula TaxID=703511 RepID=A0A6G1HKR2_9PEZI|nr:hypothetical protein EJ06DRAFT_559988 [Trichodelitschia bisporula]
MAPSFWQQLKKQATGLREKTAAYALTKKDSTAGLRDELREKIEKQAAGLRNELRDKLPTRILTKKGRGKMPRLAKTRSV